MIHRPITLALVVQYSRRQNVLIIETIVVMTPTRVTSLVEWIVLIIATNPYSRRVEPIVLIIVPYEINGVWTRRGCG